RDDGSLLVAGTMAADALADRLGIDLPDDRDYATVAGLALAVLPPDALGRSIAASADRAA
ncbi:hypothetical protein LTR94_033349, partial [Friedmanniomyces endolithicus]